MTITGRPFLPRHQKSPNTRTPFLRAPLSIVNPNLFQPYKMCECKEYSLQALTNLSILNIHTISLLMYDPRISPFVNSLIQGFLEDLSTYRARLLFATSNGGINVCDANCRIRSPSLPYLEPPPFPCSHLVSPTFFLHTFLPLSARESFFC